MNKVMIGPNMLEKMEKEIQIIKRNLKATHDKQKSYANQHIEFKDFLVGEHVYLRIKPKRISLRIRSCDKFTHHYHGPFEILERIALVEYPLELLPSVKFHDVFNVSLLMYKMLIM